jgi:hypothetical protein
MTASEHRDIHQKRVALYRRLHHWRQAQMVYMPCVASILTPSDPDAADSPSSTSLPHERVENKPLYLPSTLPATLPQQLRVTGLSPGLADKEIRLRIAQADDALAEIRRLRRVVTGLVIFKKLHVSGTGNAYNTRMRVLFQRFGHRTERVAERYRAARQALEGLDPDGSWQERLFVLRKEDIRGPGREDIRYDRNPENSEKRREQSWIWLVPRTETAAHAASTEEHLDSNLRVEWAKSRARAARWTDCKLLIEEMRRVIEFQERRAAWWRTQAHRRATESEDLCHGLAAYAKRQAAVHESIARGHALHWLPVLKKFNIQPCWGARYSSLDSTTSAGGDHDDSGSDGEDDEEVDVEVDDQTYDDFVIDP